jgi:methionyl-tRNA formyltransferase
MTERIRPDDTAGDLLTRLADGGAGLLVATLDGIEDGSLVERPQPVDGISHAPKVSVDDARLDWSHPAVVLDRQIRACTPSPGAWSTHGGERIKLGPVVVDPATEPLSPGVLRADRQAVHVGTGTTPVRLGSVKPFGKRQMPAADWVRGVRLDDGAHFGDG